MNAQDKAEALRLIGLIEPETCAMTDDGSGNFIFCIDALRNIIELQDDDTDGEMWRFCVEHGFPLVLTSSKWVAHFGVKLRCADTPAKAVQAAMAAMKEKA